MELLLIHADFLEFETKKKALKSAKKVKKKKARIDECLVAFTAVEKRDEDVKKDIIKKAVQEITHVAKEVSADRVVLYPYVHLTNDPASPSSAEEVLDDVATELKFDVERVPFGYYKAFTVKCKGHPLAELSRTITSDKEKKKEEGGEKAVKAEKKLKSDWYVLDTKGKLHKLKMKSGKLSGFNFKKYPNLEKFAKYEMAKVRTAKKEPPHVELMRKLEIADYESGSDPGHLRFYPKGTFIKKQIEGWTTNNLLDYGALQIESPLMYDFEHPSLKKYLERFPARQYVIGTPNKRVFLRFAACFGQFLMAHDAVISYKHLPVRMYELAESFRVEKRGELTGLRRTRAFTMPDCHALCEDREQAKKEMLTRFDLAKKVQKGFGFDVPGDFELGLRLVKDFYEKNKDYVKKLVKKWKKPVLVEMWDKQFFYFVLKYEFNFVDALDKASALATDQIDVENGERYDLNYIDKNGKKKHPIILHLSASGGIGRVMYALLEKAALEQKEDKNPVFPLWLSPTQVRLCPITSKDMKTAEKIADELEKEKIRVDIDDTNESTSKKVRNAEMEWVPMIIVIGKKEKKGKLPVRFRETGKVKKMTRKQLIKRVKKETEGKPFRPLPLPKMVSKRPTFVG